MDREQLKEMILEFVNENAHAIVSARLELLEQIIEVETLSKTFKNEV